MLEKIRVYYRFFKMFVSIYLKRKHELKVYKKNELEELMDLQSGILTSKHFNIVEYQGVRFDTELLQKIILEKRKREDAILENVFKK